MSILNTLVTAKQAEQRALKYIDGRRTGEIVSIRTPWQKMDDAHLDGLEWQKIITIAGMSSTGKSIIAGQLEAEMFALNPSQNFAVLSFNLEMPCQQIAIRTLIGRHQISNEILLSAKGNTLSQTQFDEISARVNNGDNVPLFYVEKPTTIKQYKYILRTFYAIMGIPFFTINDHSILFKKEAEESSLNEMLYNLADAQMELKKELPVTQINLSQLNREIEKVERRIPKHALNYPDKSCLFAADALYQCADTVMINHRPWNLQFRNNTYGIPGFPTAENNLYWHFLKARDGITAVSAMTADFKNMRILDNLPPTN